MDRPAERSARCSGPIAVALATCVLGACTVGERSTTRDSGADAQPSDSGVDGGPGYLVFFDEGLDEGVVSRFESAAASADTPPTILYPEDGTLVPPNLGGIDVHFTGRAFDTFEVTFAQHGAPRVVAYVWCRAVGSGCLFQPWEEVLAALARGRFAGPYEIRMRGLSGALVSARSEPIALELAEQEVAGAIYFWSTDPPSIRRYDFGLARRSSELFLSGEEEGSCIGCHAISDDGTRIALGVYDATRGFRARIYDVATRSAVLASEIDAPLPGYGPGTDILVSGSPPPADGTDRPLRIIAGRDGTVVEELGASGVSADWSPDGERIVFEGESGPGLRDLQLITRAAGAWQAPVVLATPDTSDERSPAFAPDSGWIGYTAMRSTDPVLAAMRVADGRVRELARAGRGLDATWVRWNPSPYDHRGRRIFWLTFSSSRGYGVVPAGPRQIWMAAFDPGADPDDPSRPAFRFPAQRPDVDNFIAEWTLTVARQPCATDADCPEGELCLEGVCAPEGPR